ncbi:hypothetical protein CPB83DRAFT_804982 [Crepidotus variabilis]|uniref:Uncharacterized protein n=1 Tax=Crepidotus variabilis TaxID=179855 RepID=A0A9P6JUY6_9AGAR|nr:hypothetical protein CPB83DRAFT_804982 [Crepidotus variabilis]
MASLNFSISTATIITTSLHPTNSLLAISAGALAAQRAPYITTTISSIAICLTLLIVLVYLAIFSWAYRAANQCPKALNTRFGVWLQRYAPGGYAFLVLSSLIIVDIAGWLVLQYRFNHNYPRSAVRMACHLLLFASCWTFLTALAYTVLFLYPAFSKHPISSIGAQVVWLFTTLLFWIIGAGILNGSVPGIIDKSQCEGIVYCFQIRLLFGMAVIESVLITVAIVAIVWLGWQSTRLAVHRTSLRPLSMLPLSTILEAFDRPKEFNDK